MLGPSLCVKNVFKEFVFQTRLGSNSSLRKCAPLLCSLLGLIYAVGTI